MMLSDDRCEDDDCGHLRMEHDDEGECQVRGCACDGYQDPDDD